MALNRHIRLCILIITFINYATSKNVMNVNEVLRPQNLDVLYGIDEVLGSFLVPADSTTIWFEDFESDISDWRVEYGLIFLIGMVIRMGLQMIITGSILLIFRMYQYTLINHQ